MRPTPSSQLEPLIKLLPPEEADLLDVEPEGGYLPVRIADGREGWVWSRNVRIDSTRHSVALGIPAYDRHEWRHWVDADGDCQDARAEALIRDADGPLEFRSPRECHVVGGVWVDPFGGDTMRVPEDLSMRQVHIDHMVPLGAAHVAGGWRWNAEKKERYANDLTDPEHLLTVLGRLNSSKSDRGPAEWMPPDTTYWCTYATIWERVKRTWALEISEEEAVAIEVGKGRCE